MESFRRRFAREQQKRVMGFTPAAMDRLSCFDWPGNVRQLENCVKHAIIFTRDEFIGTDDLPEYLWSSVGERDPRPLIPGTLGELYRAKRAQMKESVEEIERCFLARVMAVSDGSLERAAALAETTATRLEKMLSQRGLSAADFYLGEAPTQHPAPLHGTE